MKLRGRGDCCLCVDAFLKDAIELFEGERAAGGLVVLEREVRELVCFDKISSRSESRDDMDGCLLLFA